MTLLVTAAQLDAMHVGVDEPRCDHVAFSVDGFVAFDVGFRNGFNLAVPDTDVANCVQIRLRVHDPAVQDHQVVVPRLSEGNNGETAADHKSDRQSFQL
jgi:hypothetical protein